MKHLITIMKALSDPGRVKIIKMLQARPDMCVCEIKAGLGLAQPTVSKHLKILETAGLVTSSKDAQWVNYRNADNPPPYSREMLDHLAGWLADDDDIKQLLAELPNIRRDDVCG